MFHRKFSFGETFFKKSLTTTHLHYFNTLFFVTKIFSVFSPLIDSKAPLDWGDDHSALAAFTRIIP